MKQLTKLTLISAAALAFGLPSAAGAATNINLGGGLTGCTTGGCIQPSSNVEFTGSPVSTVNNPITATLNNNPAIVYFVSNSDGLSGASSNGQAKIIPVSGTLENLTFGLQSGLTFSQVEFNINTQNNTGGSALITFATVGGSYTYALGNGSNYFAAYGAPITSVTIQAQGDSTAILDVRQVRVGGISSPTTVPEPATWAMMLVGFGGIGYSMRRRRKVAPRLLQAV